MKRLLLFVLAIAMTAVSANAQESQADSASAQDLAQQLANPVASLISLPLQFNYDRQIGVDDEGERFTLNVQPVIPIRLNDKWNLISRTILPIIDQTNIVPGAGGQNGLGDILQSVF